MLDRNPRPGTKVYARYKDALLGCFKKGRYRHFGRAVEVCSCLQLQAVPSEPAMHAAAFIQSADRWSCQLSRPQVTGRLLTAAPGCAEA